MTRQAKPSRFGLPPGRVSSTVARALTDGWTLAATTPGACTGPNELPDDVDWQPALVPGTVARSVGPDDLDHHPDYDASDWWYRCAVAAPVPADGRVMLRFDGLATLAEVWWNGEKVLESANMFCAYEVDVSDLMRADNELAIVFRSLGKALSERRPRPRWKTRLVDHQQLRWFRTTLLGRIPGWTPAIHPVGPWRPVHLEHSSTVQVESLTIRTEVDEGDGVVVLDATTVRCDPAAELHAASLHVGDRAFDVSVEPAEAGWRLHASARVAQPALWWPATHGRPELHTCRLELETSSGPVTVDCDPIGFRDVRVDRSDDRVQLSVNGVPVFCRGACWTSNDIVSLVGAPARMRRTLELAAQASANMVRVGGTMVYESDDFYRACDELGIMVWQDFMFANMDYPVEDEGFARSIGVEAEQQLRRLGRHPSVVTYCGGSEVEQQAAMFGAPREIWSNRFFADTLPAMIGDHAPGTPYWPSTPTEGAMPFHLSQGLTHYFGVGAYKRPIEEARHGGVKFSPECLGFSNVPEPAGLARLHQGSAVPPHHPVWKAGVPRDSGAGWDFEDVRDHWLGKLYDVDPVELRSHDLERYLQLSRAVTGRVMAQVFDEWRSPDNPCAGGLVWFLQDLRPGAGWGIIDADNRPKAAYYHLKRAWQPIGPTFLDRGLDGLLLEVRNETHAELQATVEVSLIGSGAVTTTRGSESVRVPPRGTTTLSVEGLLGHFADPAYAYRFGPLGHQAVAAVVSIDSESEPRTAVFWPRLAEDPDRTTLSAEVDDAGDARDVSISAEGLTRDVRLDWPGWLPDDNYFDLLPGETKHVSLEVDDSAPPGRRGGFVEAANATGVRASSRA